MSKATMAKSAGQRATIALQLMRRVKDLGNCRGFDDCFEMGDGDEVVAHLILRAAKDPERAALIRRRGYGMWLEPGYLARTTTAEDRSMLIKKAIAAQDLGRPAADSTVHAYRWSWLIGKNKTGYALVCDAVWTGCASTPGSPLVDCQNCLAILAREAEEDTSVCIK